MKKNQKKCSMEEEAKSPGEKLVEEARKLCPFGHEDFIPMSVDEIELHSIKNHDYAAGGNPVGNFLRVSTILKLYPNFPYDTPEGVAIIYLFKQMDAALWLLSQGLTAKVEGQDDRWRDVSVYSKIIRILLKRNAKKSRGDYGRSESL